MKPFRVLVFVFSVWLLTAGIAAAQSTGTVQGIVKDSSGAVVPGVIVVLINTTSQQKTQTLTNGAGTYAFAFVPSGEYTLTVDHAGFNRFVREKIPVDVAGVAVADVTLQVGASTQTVTVTDVPQQLQTVTSDLDTSSITR